MLEDLPIGRRSTAWRRSQGMAFVPEERLGRGAVPELSLAQNILLSHQDGATVRHGFVRQAAIRNLAAGIIERFRVRAVGSRSEEHTSELQSLMSISYAVFCLNKKNNTKKTN